MMRFVLPLSAVLSAFLFPFPATLVLMFAASLYAPVLGILVGILVDALYYTPGASLIPLATLSGVAVSLAAFLVRRFAKARILV